MKQFNKNLPNELALQIYDIYDSWESMSKDQKLKEIDYCIERCYCNKMDYADSIGEISHYNSQIKKLIKLRKELEC